MVDDARQRGAKVLCGGQRRGTRGYFYEPTVLTHVPQEAEIMQVEPFGPVAPISAYTDLDEALGLANSLPYGLAAYGFTNSSARANCSCVASRPASYPSITRAARLLRRPPAESRQRLRTRGGGEGLEGYLITKRVSHKFNHS